MPTTEPTPASNAPGLSRAGFGIKQIAAQAGVSAATVDRVVHGRAHVRRETALRVQQALAELEAQARTGVPPGLGRYVDIVMQAPRRFSTVVTEAFTQAAAALAPLRVAPRFHCDERINATAMAERLRRIAARGTAGIVLKAPHHAELIDAVADVMAAGTPVVTWVTDLPDSQRLAYIGPDNFAAGQTAAFLLGRLLGPQPATVLTHVGSSRFLGEEQRARGFRALLNEKFPHIHVHDMAGGAGLNWPTRDLAQAALVDCHGRIGVYSIGGGNQGILNAFADADRPIAAFVGHDLDAENRRLLAAEQIDAVVEHDLTADAGQALSLLLGHHPGDPVVAPAASRCVIVTPWNL